MHERIKEIRKSSINKTLVKFGESIGISAQALSQIEIGKNSPSNATITSICRVYGVNEEWLRTGEGEMYAPKSDEEIIMERLANVQLAKGKNDEYAWLRERLASAILNLSDEGCKAMLEMLKDMGYEKKD